MRGPQEAAPVSAAGLMIGFTFQTPFFQITIWFPADMVDPVALNPAGGDDTEEMARLLAAGVAVDSEAPAPLPGGQLLAGLGQLLPGGAPKIAMTPLLAAIVHKRHRAAERLLERFR